MMVSSVALHGVVALFPGGPVPPVVDQSILFLWWGINCRCLFLLHIKNMNLRLIIMSIVAAYEQSW
jgi:hypothetical protein